MGLVDSVRQSIVNAADSAVCRIGNASQFALTYAESQPEVNSLPGFQMADALASQALTALTDGMCRQPIAPRAPSASFQRIRAYELPVRGEYMTILNDPKPASEK